MDERLIPLNGLIALTRGDGHWQRALGEMGLRIHLFEAPVFTPEGNIVADVLIYRVDPPLVLLAECKSGRHIKPVQAGRYLAAEENGIFSAGSLPPALRGKGTQVTACFAGNEDHRCDLEASMAQHEIQAPLLTVGDGCARLTGVDSLGSLHSFDVRHNSGLPPARFPIDHNSELEEIRELVVPVLIAAQARQEEFVDVESVCRDLLPEWPVVGNQAQRSFRRRVDDVLRRLAAGEFGDQLIYEPGTKATQARVRITVTPAATDPRGTPQSWQARQRRAARALGRQRAPIEGQLAFSLEDLADAGGVGEDQEELGER
jgi:hypothetical protein